MEDEKSRQFEKMTKKPIPKLIVGLAIPTVCSMLVTALYNMADTYFVSQLGTSASGAVGVVFSLMAIIQAIGFMLGIGSGSIISRKLGEKKNKDASRFASTAFFTSLVAGILITIFGLLFIDGLMRILGATETILPYAKDYAQYILLGASVMGGSFVLNNILRAEGKAVFSMIGLTIGGFLNIILDPILINVLKLGISGAAIATLISQCVSFVILLSFFVFKKSQLKLSIKNISRKAGDYLNIIKIGFPSMCRQGLASIATICLNLQAAAYGDEAIAAFSIVSRMFMFVLSVILGIGQGFQPVAGYNYGAKLYKRVKSAFIFTAFMGFVFMLVLSVLGYIFAPQLISIFRPDDEKVIEIGALAMRLQCIVLPLQAPTVAVNMLFQSTGKAKSATFLSCTRQGIFFLPLVFLLPLCFDLFGLQTAQPAADLLSAAVCIPFVIVFFKRLKKLPTQ